MAYGGTGVTSLSNVLGTTNQVTVTNGTARVIGGDITLSLPQNIHTAATPQFAGLTLTGRQANILDAAANGLYLIENIKHYINNGSSVAGPIKITMPFTTSSSTMVGIKLFIYDYNATHNSADSIEMYIQFYTTGGAIHNENVFVYGGRESLISAVRFGNNASNNVQIFIDLNNNLAYPKVLIKEVYTSHNNAETSTYRDSAN